MQKLLNGTCCMMLAFKFQVFFIRQFRRIKSTCADAFSINHNLRSPFSLMGADTKKTCFVGFSWVPHILQITKAGNFTKIVKFVVLFVSILMVYVKRWKIASHVQPRKSVRQSFLIVDGNSPIPRICRTAGTFSNKIWASAMGFPHKFTCGGVVVKNGSKMVSGNHDFQFTIGMVK